MKEASVACIRLLVNKKEQFAVQNVAEITFLYIFKYDIVIFSVLHAGIAKRFYLCTYK